MDECLSCISASVSSSDQQFFTKIRALLVVDDLILTLSTQEDTNWQHGPNQNQPQLFPYYIAVHSLTPRINQQGRQLQLSAQYCNEADGLMAQLFVVQHGKVGSSDLLIAVVGVNIKNEITMGQFIRLSPKQNRQLQIQSAGNFQYQGLMHFQYVYTDSGIYQSAVIYQKQKFSPTYFSFAHLTKAYTHLDPLSDLSPSLKLDELLLDTPTPQQASRMPYVTTCKYLTVTNLAQQGPCTVLTYQIKKKRLQKLSLIKRAFLGYIRNINSMLICVGADGQQRDVDYFIHVLLRKSLQLLHNINTFPTPHQGPARLHLTSHCNQVAVVRKGYVLCEDDQQTFSLTKLPSSLEADYFSIVQDGLIVIGNLDEIFVIATGISPSQNSKNDQAQDQMYMAM